MYVKPEIELMEIEFESYMLGASDLGIEGGGDSDGGDGSPSPEANRHRGEWGNLWAED